MVSMVGGWMRRKICGDVVLIEWLWWSHVRWVASSEVMLREYLVCVTESRAAEVM